MTQAILNKFWLMNRWAIKWGIPLFSFACSDDQFEQTIELFQWTWHRAQGATVWEQMKPLKGNL